MSFEKEYPLIQNLDLIKKTQNKTDIEYLDAIISVLDAEVVSRNIENKDKTVPDNMFRAKLYRWDVARAVFNNKKILDLINTLETKNIVNYSYFLCKEFGSVFYQSTTLLFFNFYSDQSGNGLPAKTTNEIIKDIFGEHFTILEKSFEDFIIPHVSRMINAPDHFDSIEKSSFKKREISHYQKTYENAFFFEYIQKSIKANT